MLRSIYRTILECHEHLAYCITGNVCGHNICIIVSGMILHSCIFASLAASV